MKRVTLNASDVSQHADATVITLVISEAPYLSRDIVVPNVLVHSVEDVPDPLPTTPGTHIVAKVQRHLPDGTYPETDTVVIVVDTDPESGDINYRSTTPVRGFYVHRPSDIKAWKRLDIPDPEVAP